MNGILRMALGLADVPDKTIEDLDKALPAIERLIVALRELTPILEEAQPLINKAMPILKTAYPDAVATLPVLQELVHFLNGKLTTK